MRSPNVARPLRSPFRPGGIAHALEREDVTLSLVELEPEADGVAAMSVARGLEPGAYDLLEPPTVDIDLLVEEDRSGTFESGTHRVAPPRSEVRTPVLRRSWICMPPGNTNAEQRDLSRLDIKRLQEIVGRRTGAARAPVTRVPPVALPRFPLLPAAPCPKAAAAAPLPRFPLRAAAPKSKSIPPLRLPRFSVD